MRKLPLAALVLSLVGLLVASPAMATEPEELINANQPAHAVDADSTPIPEEVSGDEVVAEGADTDSPPPAAPDAWFSENAEVPAELLENTEPEGTAAVRTFEFDAEAALRSLVPSEQLVPVLPGNREVLEPLSATIDLAGLNAEAVEVSVLEIATTRKQNENELPTVEVLGTLAGKDAAVAFAFVPNETGEYTLVGTIEGEEDIDTQVGPVSGTAYRLDEIPNATTEGLLDAQDASEPYGNDAPMAVNEEYDAILEARDPSIAAAAASTHNVTVLFGATTGTGSLASMKNETALRVSQTNSAFVNSQMKTRIVLMDTVAVAYTQHSSDMAQDLYNATDGKGGFKSLLRKRDAIGADLVSVIVPNMSNYCGIAWRSPVLTGTLGATVSVSAKPCLSTYTFAHELGHNLGSHHDRANATGNVAAPYAYGYAIPGVARDIMSYECTTACSRKNQFANPNVNFISLSQKSGASNANAARVIDEVAANAKNYRATVVAWDVPTNHKFYTQINWLLNKRITTGYSDGTFRPTATLTREAMAAFLYRYAGSPSYTPPATSPFTDVPKNHKFYKEITWLRAKGITTGRADGSFGPTDSITREAMSAFLYRFAGKPSYTAPGTSPFSDVPKSNQFYKEISWMKAMGISTGNADGTFGPKSAVTREAAAAFLYRYDAKF